MAVRLTEESTPAQPRMRVLRLCSVFMPPSDSLAGEAAKFDLMGGMQNHTNELTRALDRLGVVQKVVTSRPPGAPKWQMVGRSEVFRLGYRIRAGRGVYSLPASRYVARLAPRADLVHLHVGEDLALLPLAEWAAIKNRIPLVVTVHCSMRHTLRPVDFRTSVLRSLGAGLERRVVARADSVIVLTSRLAGLLQADGLASNRLSVIPPGLDQALFEQEVEDPFVGWESPRVVFVGRLVRAKGVHVLLEAARHLWHPCASIVFVGDGPERGALEAAAARYGLSERVHFTGFLPHERMPAVLAASSLLVMPSLYEELGTVAIEAMRAGVPIVGSDTGGIPEVVEHGRTGLLVPPGDAGALARAIDTLLGDAELRGGMSARQVLRAPAHDWRAVASRVLSIYESLLRDRKTVFTERSQIAQVDLTSQSGRGRL